MATTRAGVYERPRVHAPLDSSLRFGPVVSMRSVRTGAATRCDGSASARLAFVATASTPATARTIELDLNFMGALLRTSPRGKASRVPPKRGKTRRVFQRIQRFQLEFALGMQRRVSCARARRALSTILTRGGGPRGA